MEKSIHSPNYKIFVKLLKEKREEASITQEEIAVALQTTQTVISKSERAERRIDILELHLWCRAIGISMTEFVKELEEKLQSRMRKSL